MSTAAIELNDAGIAIAREETLLPESPGYALLDDERLVVGVEACRRARLYPRQVHDAFWDRLSLDSLPRPSPLAHTHADLACAHLAHVWEGLEGAAEGMILAVPGCLDRSQLGLLLGIAQSCSIPVVGMVDAAAAACASSERAGKLVHADLHLHSAVLTTLASGDSVRRTGVQTSRRIALASLHDAWVKLIAELFVRHTRFDPLHQAPTEQQLFDHLPECLSRLRREKSVEIQMEVGGRTYGVVLRREQVVQAARPSYQQLAAQVQASRAPGEPIALYVSARLAGLPGLCEALGEIAACELVALGRGAAALGALAREGEIRSPRDAILFVSALARAHPVALAREPVPSPSAAHTQPTHLLYRDLAYPIGAKSLAIGAEVSPRDRGIRIAAADGSISPRHCSVFRNGKDVWIEDHSESGTFVNEDRVEGTARLRVGDCVRVGRPGEELRLIAVRGKREA